MRTPHPTPEPIPEAEGDAIEACGDDAAYEAALARVTIGSPRKLEGRIELKEYDPAWAGLYRREAGRIRAALGDRIRLLEHVGSTSVPGLVAKPVIDVLLGVADSADEAAYVPDLEGAGYRLCIREPEFFEHRLLKGPDTDINLHVFSEGCEEAGRMLAFRDRLLSDPVARDLYARAKRELASREWIYVQQYADAKTGVIRSILGLP